MAQDLVDDRRGPLAHLGRPEYRPGAAQRHMLPGPGFLALIALERVERDDQHALGALGPEPRIDVVERPAAVGTLSAAVTRLARRLK